jgi:hypothetical protein
VWRDDDFFVGANNAEGATRLAAAEITPSFAVFLSTAAFVTATDLQHRRLGFHRHHLGRP